MTDLGQPATSELEALARKIAEAGPFYDGIDDGFCAVCDAYFTIGEWHKSDCAYVALCRLLDVPVEGPRCLM